MRRSGSSRYHAHQVLRAEAAVLALRDLQKLSQTGREAFVPGAFTHLLIACFTRHGMSQLDVLDTDRLTPYLEAHVAGFQGPISATTVSGRQSNPTFHVQAGSGAYVLRRKPPGKLRKSAHAVDREYRVMRALADTDVPVPEVYHLCEDRAVIGSLFFLMALCNGRIFWNAAIPEVDPAQRSAMYAEMNRVLSGLHAV